MIEGIEKEGLLRFLTTDNQKHLGQFSSKFRVDGETLYIYFTL